MSDHDFQSILKLPENLTAAWKNLDKTKVDDNCYLLLGFLCIDFLRVQLTRTVKINANRSWKAVSFRWTDITSEKVENKMMIINIVEKHFPSLTEIFV